MSSQAFKQPKSSFDLRVTTVLSFITFVLLLVYYFTGQNSVPQAVLLPVAGQVMSTGIQALCSIIFDILTRMSTTHPLPLDAVTAFLVNIDTRLGGAFTPEALVLVPLVQLLFLHTPETLLGTLASGKPDIRSTNEIREFVELGPFGGAWDRRTYYLSGQLLLSETDPDTAYRQVAYRIPQGWVVTRKPTVWYSVFRKNLLRDNDAEKRVFVPHNEAAILVPVSQLPSECNTKNISDFGFWLTLHHCDNYFGFSFGGHVRETHGFYRLYHGSVSAAYSSHRGERFVVGSGPTRMEPIVLPRVDQLWQDMSSCFNNAVSFNRPPADIPLTDRLALSSLVRIAAFQHRSGFSTPPRKTEALVTDVKNTNLSRWVIVIVGGATFLEVLRIILLRFRKPLLGAELENLIAGLRHVDGISAVPRYARKHRDWTLRIWGQVGRNEAGGVEIIVPGGLDGGNDSQRQDSGDRETGGEETDSDSTQV